MSLDLARSGLEPEGKTGASDRIDHRSQDQAVPLVQSCLGLLNSSWKLEHVARCWCAFCLLAEVLVKMNWQPTCVQLQFVPLCAPFHEGNQFLLHSESASCCSTTTAEQQSSHRTTAWLPGSQLLLKHGLAHLRFDSLCFTLAHDVHSADCDRRAFAAHLSRFHLPQ